MDKWKRFLRCFLASAALIVLNVGIASAAPYWIDPNPPVLKSVSVDKGTATLGETVTVSYDVADADGVASVSIGFSNEDPASMTELGPGQAVAIVGPTYGSSGDTSKSFEYKISHYDAPGPRYLTSVAITDSRGYETVIYDTTYAQKVKYTDVSTFDMSAAHFEITAAQPEVNLPELKSISVDKDTAKLGETVTISYDVVDADGVTNVSLGYWDQDPASMPNWDPSNPVASSGSIASGSDTSKSFAYKVGAWDSPGSRYVVSLTVTDRLGYSTTFYDTTYTQKMGYERVKTFDMSAAHFEILEPDAEPNPPVLKSVSVDKAEVTLGETVNVSYDLIDADGIASVGVRFSEQDPASMPGLDPGQGISWPMSSSYAPNTANSYPFTVRHYDAPGPRYLVSLTVTDSLGYVTTFYDPVYAQKMGYTDAKTFDMSAARFTIVEKAASEKPGDGDGTGGSGDKDDDKTPIKNPDDTTNPNNPPIGNTPGDSDKTYTYTATSGNNAVYDPSKNESFEVRFDAPFENFVRLEIDGNAVLDKNYESKSGSTVITLKPDFMKSLSAGSHKLTAHYTDGSKAEATFTVKASDTSGGDQGGNGGNGGNDGPNSEGDAGGNDGTSNQGNNKTNSGNIIGNSNGNSSSNSNNTSNSGNTISTSGNATSTGSYGANASSNATDAAKTGANLAKTGDAKPYAAFMLAYTGLVSLVLIGTAAFLAFRRRKAEETQR